MDNTKEWTLMFYFASDNPLAASIVSQLKSIKQAGFHLDANVIAQFDPQIEGTPTHIFDVNRIEKLQASVEYKIGSTDPTDVPTLVTDKLWGKQESRNGGLVSDQIRASLRGKAPSNYRPPQPPVSHLPSKRAGEFNKKGVEPSPKESLSGFLKFCREYYPARHYMLFVLGHGLVVGTDLFLFDEHASEQSLSLKNLGEVLSNFKANINKDAQLELISFHSCSMSGLEIAFELKDYANYMLASQGPAFVGTWPYRQILMSLFSNLANGLNVQETLKTVHDFCVRNSYDFQLAGYSFDLCLCNLGKVKQITRPLKSLSGALMKGLAEPESRDLILLAHWDAQSYWEETYTDLYDFCYRLEKRSANARQSATVKAIRKECYNVMRKLEQGDDQLVIKSQIAGPAYQYSHGLSVFFPWSRPIINSFWPDDYMKYDFKDTSWREFLVEYFSKTMREPRGSEIKERTEKATAPTLVQNLLEEISSPGRLGPGQLSKGGPGDATGGPKAGATDPTGGPKAGGGDPTGDTSAPAIKNYPAYTRKALDKGIRSKSSNTRARRKRP